MAADPSVTIPVRDGITEGGLIIVGILAVVLGVLAVIVLVLWKFGSQIASRMKAVQEQVANDHAHPDGTPINLRDDMDGKHDENTRKLDQALSILTTMQRDVSEVQTHVTFLLRRSIQQDDRIDALEDTVETPNRQKERL